MKLLVSMPNTLVISNCCYINFTTAPHIKGGAIVAVTKVDIHPENGLYYKWEKKGIEITIPAGAISTDSGPVTLSMQESYSGNYKFPDGSVLVSGVYWLALNPSVKFAQKATIRIQHCAGADSALFFVTAKCTQETLPYQFEQLSGDISTYTDCSSTIPYDYGCIQVEHFSAVAVVAKQISFYAFCTYYLPREEPNHYETHITVTPNLEQHVEVCYCNNCSIVYVICTLHVYVEGEQYL